MIKCKKAWIVYESTTMTCIDPEYLSLTKSDIQKYFHDHPMPEDPEYSKEDLVQDLTQSSGFLELPPNTKEETRIYVVELLNTLVK